MRRTSRARRSTRRSAAGRRSKEELREAAGEKLEKGYAPSTAAGEYVREEMHHVREGKHGAASPKQAIAIGLSKARREGVPLPPRRRRNA